MPQKKESNPVRKLNNLSAVLFLFVLFQHSVVQAHPNLKATFEHGLSNVL